MSSDNKFIRSLIENAKQGNNAAIEQLFQMNLGKIYAVALRLTANKHLAEIITHETFTEAWKRITLVRSDASFLKWLVAITVYKTLDSIRNKKEKIKINHHELWELESKDELDKYIFALPDQERMIFVLNKIEGYSVDEISDMMGIRKDQVNTHLLIAQSKLIEALPTLKSDEVMKEKISKVIPELQPSAEVQKGIFSYIMDEKIREQKEQEKLAASIEEKEKQDQTEGVIPDFRENIVKDESKPKKKFTFNFNFNFNIIKKVGYVILGLAVIVTAYIFITSGGGWEIISLSGNPTQNGVPLNKDDEFEDKATIETNVSSSLSVMMQGLGRLLIEPSTVISRTRTSNELKLDKGQIKKYESDASDVVIFITPLAKLKELYKGGEFKLFVDNEGNSELTVESGWMLVTVNDFDSYVPKNFGCKISKEKYAIPYSKDSPEQMKVILQNFSGFNDPALSTIISSATKKDALSLWHILQLISPESRSLAFDKLNELIPAPNGVTKEGIIPLNKTMLLDWRQEIELKMD